VANGIWTTDEYERSQFYRCYTLGHAWYDYDDTGPAPITGTPLMLRCERCGTNRRDVVQDGTGELIWRRYDYPDGYKYGSEARPTRSDFRVMLLQQRIDETRKSRRKTS